MVGRERGGTRAATLLVVALLGSLADGRSREAGPAETARTLRGALKGFVNSLSFAPDGRTLASASTDGGVRIWGVESGRSRDVIRRSSATAAALMQHAPRSSRACTSCRCPS